MSCLAYKALLIRTPGISVYNKYVTYDINHIILCSFIETTGQEKHSFLRTCQLPI